MLRIRKFGENSCGYNAALWNCCLILRGYATMSFRQGYANGLGLTDRNFDRIGVRGKVGPGPVSGDDFCVNVSVFCELTI